MKDECGGTPISEFVGPKPKSYMLIDINNCEKSVHKGHKFNFKSNEFKNLVNNKKVISHPIKKVRSKKYIIYIKNSNKIYLSCYDDKITYKKYIFFS